MLHITYFELTLSLHGFLGLSRLLEQRLRDEAAQEVLARKEQEAASLEAEWDAANARVTAELDMRLARKTHRQEVYQSTKGAK